MINHFVFSDEPSSVNKITDYMNSPGDEEISNGKIAICNIDENHISHFDQRTFKCLIKSSTGVSFL